MEEKEISEKEIDKALEELISNYPHPTIKFLAKILFNCRHDIVELRTGLLKVFKPDENQAEIDRLDSLEDHGGFYT